MEHVIEVSKTIWKAMQEEDVEKLQNLIHPEAVFVHMGVTLKRDAEIDVIKTKKIVYKEVEIEAQTFTTILDTTVLLTKVKLTAIVGGNEVCNPFVVSEVYITQDREQKLASMSYTKIIY